MIQRIQSLWFLLAAISFGLLFLLPLAMGMPTEQGILSDGVYETLDNPALSILAGAAAILSLVALGLFKNRSLQRSFGVLLVLISIAFPIIAYLINSQDNNAELSLMHGAILPVVSLIASLLGIYYVRKDEKFLKEMDRLR